MRRTPLKRRTPLRRRFRDSLEYRKVRRWVADRSGGLCEAQISGVCAVRGVHAHHVLPRSAGGTDAPSNLVWLCAQCHRHVHDNPAWAVEAGLLRRRSA